MALGDNDWGADLPVPDADWSAIVLDDGTLSWGNRPIETQQSDPPQPQAYSQALPPVGQRPPLVTTGGIRKVLIGSAMVLIIGLLAVIGVAVTRSGGKSPAPAAMTTTTAPASTLNINGLCFKLTDSLPAKARGLHLVPARFNGKSNQHCDWLTTDPDGNSTWALMVDVAVFPDAFAAQKWFDEIMGMMAKGYSATIDPLPGVGDKALTARIPDTDIPGILAPKFPGALPEIDHTDHSRPGAAVLVRVGGVFVRIQWVGTEYPPGTRARDSRSLRGTPLPPEQARSEAIQLATDVMRLIGV
ncbi:hypothetical protein [Nocardia stercoris]|uniref:DUF3558 domain-containing protein n=1 Tax=Nocardia stercoris TaxID=2483361 RepID=A0A3M2LFI7_9NOCA|nr:hypothetical protein [Nocardia stercoris]RMI33458.1 hypothetical protein EBN03_09990 [Nocardia stercoris]